MSTYCNCMFHVFQIYVAYVLSGCCKSRSGIAYVVMVIHVYCKCMFQMFQLFQIYVTSVSSGYCICCSGYTRKLQVCFPNISVVSSRCCMFSSGCCICCNSYTRYVASVCSKCFTYFRHMLQAFYLDVACVAMVIHICCKHMF
jgi:hypothetical protein